MRCTLLGELTFFKKDQIESLNRTVNFLQARGMFRDYKGDDFWYSEDPKKIINIELIEVPIIFDKLKEISYFQRYDYSAKNIENVKNNIFRVNVLEISEMGLSIYFDYPTSEHIVFIASNQISCIHNISDVKFNKMSGWKSRLLAKKDVI